MHIYKFIIGLSLYFFSFQSFSQSNCGTLGQDPGTAFPVCGTDTFYQKDVPICGGKSIPTPGCSGLADLNPFWYRFTCFSAGTLGFLISPKNLNDDYDWQLFDITGKSASLVFTDPSLFVACNWSGMPGNTGASTDGISLTVCGNTGTEPLFNPFSSMPQLILGHEYILLISHFSGDSQSGYALSFGAANGGTASITDSTEPNLKAARAICDGIKMTVKLNKKMKCNSLNPDGSDFTLTPALAPVIAAEGINCTNGFDMDSILLTLANPIPPGNYQITIKNDVNGINLLDNCSRGIPLGQFLPVTVFPLFPTPMDSLTKVACAPEVLELVFNKPLFCSSIAADGSDFKVTGSSAVTILKAAGICNSTGFTNSIQVYLSKPIFKKGNYRIELQIGTDGNTILNECSKETAAGSFINFSTSDTVSANFNQSIKWGCKTDTINYMHDGLNGVNSWRWIFDNHILSIEQNPSVKYKIFGTKNAQLIVSNGVCNDTSAVTTILLDNVLKAAFESTSVVCPDDPASFIDNSVNRIIGWNWTFGNGSSSVLKSPPGQRYPPGNNTRELAVRLIVQNDIGCFDTTVNTIKVVGNCFIAVPKAFTPNRDGLNDFLFPTNAYKAKDLHFVIYNREGQKLFETRDWTNKWDGSFKGNPQDPGTYVWTLVYTYIETGQQYNLKGSTVLIR